MRARSAISTGCASRARCCPRERIEKLLDPGTPFLELSSLAANMAYDGEVPGAGSIVGIGIVSGREVMIRADDPTVKGGAWYPLTVKKIVRALDIAIENRLPVVHLCDSAGGFLPLQAEIFAGQVHGRPHLPQPVRSCRRWACKQLALVFGHCTAGGAYIPALSRLQRHRARHRRGLPRRPAAGEGRDRRGRHRRGARRRRHAHQHLRHLPTIRRQARTRRSRSAARSSAQCKRPQKTGLPARRRRRRRSTIRRRSTAILPRRHQEAVRHARGHRAHRRRQPLPRIPAELRHDADLRLRATSGASRSASSPTTACCSTTPR